MRDGVVLALAAAWRGEALGRRPVAPRDLRARQPPRSPLVITRSTGPRSSRRRHRHRRHRRAGGRRRAGHRRGGAAPARNQRWGGPPGIGRGWVPKSSGADDPGVTTTRSADPLAGTPQHARNGPLPGGVGGRGGRGVLRLKADSNRSMSSGGGRGGVGGPRGQGAVQARVRRAVRGQASPPSARPHGEERSEDDDSIIGGPPGRGPPPQRIRRGRVARHRPRRQVPRPQVSAEKRPAPRRRGGQVGEVPAVDQRRDAR